ncbi:MAG: exo-alpha-sialidase [Bryobacteraceae bacterium]
MLLALLLAAAQGALGPLELATPEGSLLVLRNYGERRGTLVVFLSTRSQAVRAVAGWLGELDGEYRRQGILLVGVFPNDFETGAEVRRFAQSMGFTFPVYRDPQARAARLAGARVTPEALLVDAQGTVAYRGAVGRDLEATVRELAAGRQVTARGSPASGEPIGKPGSAAEPEDPYGSVWFSSELIFQRIPGAPAHHASTMVETPEGDLLVAWYGGSYESSDDQALYLSRRRKGQKQWSEPLVLIPHSLQPPGNAVLFRDPENRIWLVWGRMEAGRPLRRGGGWSECRLFQRFSTDGGRTWSSDQEIPGSFGWLSRNPPVTLSDGTLVLPLSSREGPVFLRARDPASGWTRSAPLAAGTQPALAVRPDGSLLALLRSAPRILSSESGDGGASWTPPAATALRNPNAGIAVARLASGRLLLVFNESETARTPLAVARSHDGGQSWREPLALESNPGEYSYPCVIQSSDGMIHVTYTFRRNSIKHVEFDEGWLEHLERPN